MIYFYSFLAHMSRRLKWAFLIKICPLSVVVVGIVVNFSHFHLLLQNHWVSFNQTWHNASFGEGNSSLFKCRALPFSKGDNYEKGNILWRNFLLQNYWANFMIYTGIIIALLICFYWGERCGPWASCKDYVSQVLRVSWGMGMSVGEVKDSF